jgi:hypothetical protein
MSCGFAHDGCVNWEDEAECEFGEKTKTVVCGDVRVSSLSVGKSDGLCGEEFFGWLGGICGSVFLDGTMCGCHEGGTMIV